MRIISGEARGTKLFTLEGKNTRPTLDRVKEALFSIIQNQVLEAKVLDLFSGSGALALESLSRGAKEVILCDNSKEAISIIKKNINKAKCENKTRVMMADYKVALNKLKEEKNVFDIIFLDPPYATDFDIKAINYIITENLLSENGIIIVETDSEDKIKQIEQIKINILKIKKYGRVRLVFLNRKG